MSDAPSLVSGSRTGPSARNADTPSILAALGHLPAQAPTPYGGRSMSKAWLWSVLALLVLAGLVWAYTSVLASAKAPQMPVVAQAPTRLPTSNSAARADVKPPGRSSVAEAASAVVGGNDAVSSKVAAVPTVAEGARNEPAAVAASTATLEALPTSQQQPSQSQPSQQRETPAAKVAPVTSTYAAKRPADTTSASRERRSSNSASSAPNNRVAQARPQPQRKPSRRPSTEASAEAAAGLGSPSLGSPSPGSPNLAATNDADIAVVSALMGHSAAPARPEAPATLASVVQQCRSLTSAEALACRKRICAGYWGLAKACPANQRPRSSAPR